MSHVVITGSASGIGRALTERFVAEGWTVTGIDRNAARPLAGAYKHLFADITDEVMIEGALKRAADLAPVDAVFSNAAVTDLDHKRVIDLSYAAWIKVIRVNVDGAFLTARAAARNMPNGGNIVFVTSSLAFFSEAKANDAPYCTSKSAVEMLMRVLALELGDKGINVNTLFPSVRIRTGFFAHLPPAEQAELAPPGILDEAALFLAGLKPGHLTGHSLDQQRWDDDPAYCQSLKEGTSR